MDGSDVQLAIRRAKRANAKVLDLSLRGLREWPEGIFALRQLESIDVSGNELRGVDSGIQQLELLEELNLSNNRLDAAPAFGGRCPPCLRSLQLEGNPVAARMAPATVRQLARPPHTPGQTPAQVIEGLLAASGGGSEASSRPSVARLDSMRASRPGSAANDARPSPERTTSSHWRGPGHEPDDSGHGGAASEATPSWLQHTKPSGDAAEGLHARIRELEAELAAAKEAGAPAPDSSKPSWLQESKRGLAHTLPSRRGNMGNEDGGEEADGLRAQLKDEQRKSKRLEQDVQRLTSRLQEREMQKQNIGSVPHFDFAEVEMGNMINQGGFSVVYKGRWHKTPVAVKKLFDPKIDQALLDEFDNEVQKLEQIRHPNVLLLMGVHRKPPALSIITELVEGGSFSELLHTPARFNSGTLGPIDLDLRKTLEILERSGTAIAYLHGRGIAHRDIKTQNVLLTPQLEVKLCDFGLARMKSELMTGAMQFAGTPNYMAPEIFRNEKYTENVDVWAFGIMMWEALAKDIPFANLDAPEIRDKVLKGGQQMLQMPASAPSDLHSIMRSCWTADRNTRPPMSEVVALLQTSVENADTAGRASRVGRPRTSPGGSRPSPSGTQLGTQMQSRLASDAPVSRSGLTSGGPRRGLDSGTMGVP